MQSGQRRANCRRTGDCRDKRGEEGGRRKEKFLQRRRLSGIMAFWGEVSGSEVV
jgi:hypothetical protein